MENKHITCNRERRDEEFLALYKETLAIMLEGHVSNARSAAIGFTLRNGRPHYHVSFDRGYPVVCALLKHHKHMVNSPLRQQMWEEIATKVKEIIDHNRISIAKALDFVLRHCRASRFYMSESYAWRYVYEAGKRHKKKMLRKLHVAA